MTFESLGLDRPILDALALQGYATPTPIQAQAIPEILKGRDVVGIAQTGTGKTAAFTLPLLHRLMNNRIPVKPNSVRVLVLSPTRELASQIEKAVRSYGAKLPLKSATVMGGVSMRPQRQKLAQGVDILVATPGRLLDLIEQKALDLKRVETLVLDEADQMLDIGFLPAIRKVIAMVPKERQMLLFSATMPKEIRNLTRQHLKDPAEISVTPVATTADRIDQSVMHVQQPSKMFVTSKMLKQRVREQTIVFTRTKRGADKVAKRLIADGINAAAIHGNKSQNQREKALAAFRNGSLPVLIATDIAARGIDVPGVNLIVNFDLPEVAEVYVHRIGRTARAGAAGQAIALCAPEERKLLRAVERLIQREIPVIAAPEGVAAVDMSVEPVSERKAGRPNKPHRQQRSRPNSTRRPAARSRGRSGQRQAAAAG
uniref:DEAD/DEAH box helicase n=1 Tax=Pararhizobium sp. IMCC3301 TaxID=3067904 RepID=UPI0027419BD3|nr:DEAD/DEAH box helicase [Pararhizobium sp. IMCC3301]